MVGVDFSNYSKLTLEHAVEIAKLSDAELMIVNVINQRDVDLMENSLEKISSMHKFNKVEEWIQGLQDGRLGEMEKLKSKVNLSQVKYNFEFRIGYPIEELLKLINEQGIDLVIVGLKGRSDLDSFFVGSVGSKLSRRCPVPLTIVPNPK